MIVPMKKIALVVEDVETLPALDALRGLGVLHVEPLRPPSGIRLTELAEQDKTLQRAIEILSGYRGRGGDSEDRGDWEDCVRRALGGQRRIEELTDRQGRLMAAVRDWEAWGDFDPQDVRDLEAGGVWVRCVILHPADRERIPDGVAVEEIARRGRKVLALAISRSPDPLPFETLPLPEASLTEMRRRLDEVRAEIEETERGLRETARSLPVLQRARGEIRSEMAFQSVFHGRGTDSGLAAFQGYCPIDGVADLEAEARRRAWGIRATDPDPEDEVPTLLRMPGWVETIRPVFAMMDVVPGYREYDISTVFLVFFSLFVGILIGDAGYALVYGALLLRLWRRTPKRGKAVVPAFRLGAAFCVSAFVWGVLSGTYFGQAWLPPAVRPVIPWLSDPVHLQALCFFIGAVHLSIAHGWRFLALWPSPAAWGQAGWLMVLWGAYFLAQSLILGAAFPAAGRWVLWGGLGMVLFFSAPDRNLLRAVGRGLGDLAMNIISSFTDLVSYIRLFAVGFAAVAVADAANTSVFGFALLHPLNLMLGLLAIMVHGLRLNVLEFTNHMGMEWKGRPYRPFGRESES